MSFGELIKQYGSIGAGGVAIITLAYITFVMITKISPLLQSIETSNVRQAEIVRNNTDAIKEMSKSNENVANALKLLDHSISSFTNLLEKHDERAEKMNIDIVKITENTRKCGGVQNGY